MFSVGLSVLRILEGCIDDGIAGCVVNIARC